MTESGAGLPADQQQQLRAQWEAIENTAQADPQAALLQAQTLLKQVVEDLMMQPTLDRYREFFARLTAG